jgi:hypothetical protein
MVTSGASLPAVNPWGVESCITYKVLFLSRICFISHALFAALPNTGAPAHGGDRLVS